MPVTILSRLRPNILVLQNMSEEKGCCPQRIRRLNEAIAQLAKRHAVPIVAFTRAELRRHFCIFRNRDKGRDCDDNREAYAGIRAISARPA
jgi:hypothetical protein